MKYRIKPELYIRYPVDCLRIATILRKKGLPCSLFDAQQLWEKYSEELCAGWLVLPDEDKSGDELIWEYLKDYLEETEEYSTLIDWE